MLDDAYVDRKAAQLRTALIEAGVAFSPDPQKGFDVLPESRKERWREFARAYMSIFCV